MTPMPQAIEAARRIADTTCIADVRYEDAYQTARALLALAAPGQSATDALNDILRAAPHRETMTNIIAAFAAAQVAAEREALTEQWRLTLEMAEDMLGYVPDYFKTKYHYDDEITAMRAALQARGAKP